MKVFILKTYSGLIACRVAITIHTVLEYTGFAFS
ncbi:hypothetical protein GMORB2_4282 [Geosmithia morbida]|uniref:Uncharacterized protein n=1 Tax=Geosmithia morbida TaxID=1094350 RepID=A0A9P4YZK6_9HYPO|nr:uncharacterized protein GMORB2_4282 [Geosmithia morbida]KAF4125442.1 hypothetical protein GMORB2_4282 [Geosmithia morbida]